MRDQIKSYEWITSLYLEVAKRAIEYSPQLFIWSIDAERDLEALGSSVLFKVGQDHYLITAGHCLRQNGEDINIGVLNAKNEMHLVRGAVIIKTGDGGEIDLGIVKLSSATTEMMFQKYKFLDVTQIMFNKGIPDETDYLVVGYPITKTKINNRTKCLSSEPFVFIGKSKDAKTYERFAYNVKVNTLIRFTKRKSTYVEKLEMNMSPEPKGISGGGLWFIQSYEIEKKEDVVFFLCGIMIEHDDINNFMIATKTEALVQLIQASHTVNANQPIVP